MSTEVKIQDQNEAGVSLRSESAPAPAGGTAHLAMMGASTDELLRATLGNGVGSFNEDALYLLDDDEKEMAKSASKQQEIIQEVGNGAGISGKGAAPTGKDAIFEAAKDIQLLQTKAQKSLENQIQQELKLLKIQLEAAEKEEAFWEKFTQDWAKYEKNPSYQNFKALMEDIMKEYPKGSKKYESAKNALAKGKEAWDKEEHWEHESHWDRFKHFQWVNPHAWRGFREDEASALKQMVNEGTATPGMFSLYLENITSIVKDQVKNLMFQIQFLQAVEVILSGKGNPIVMMESLMMIVSQMGLTKNSEQVDRNNLLNNATIFGLREKNQQIEKEIKKLHSEHHGLFGWLEDFVKSIAKEFERYFECFQDLFEGNWSQLGTNLEDMTGVDKIYDALKEIVNGIKNKDWSELGKGLENLSIDAVLVYLFGPMALAFLDTSFGKDITQTMKLAIDTVIAALESVKGLIVAAGDAMSGSKTKASDALNKIGNAWKKVIENPQLKAVMQLVMVVMIVAAVASQQYWLAGLMVALFVLSASGLLSKATNALAGEFAKIPGLSKDVAKVLADATVILIVTLLSFGAGSLGAGADVAATEAADEEGEEIASQVNQQAESAAEKSKGILNKIGNAIGRRTGASLTGLGASLGSTSFGEDIAEAFIKKNKKEWEMILEIIQGVIAAISSLAGGLGIGASDTVSTADESIKQGLGKILPKLAKYMEDNSAALMDASMKMQGGGMVVGGVASMEVGGSQINQGEIMRDLREMQADMTLFNAESDATERSTQYLSGRYKILMKEMENIVKEVNQAVTLPIQGVVRALMGQA